MESPRRNKKVLGLEHRDNDDEDDDEDDQDMYVDDVDEIEGYTAEELQFSSGD